MQSYFTALYGIGHSLLILLTLDITFEKVRKSLTLSYT